MRPRWLYGIAALWLIIAVLGLIEWFFADDSGDRWRAGLQFVLATAIGMAYVARARKVRRQEPGS